MDSGNKTALVLGATGGIGGEVARQLRDSGWTVHALKRAAAEALHREDGITWHRGDAMNRDEVMRAAEGCAVIVHAVNPPGYRDWEKMVLPMLDNTIAAATAGEATIVLPGTVYNFGPDALPVLREDSPQQPLTQKGAIRVEMERRLEAASKRGGHWDADGMQMAQAIQRVVAGRTGRMPSISATPWWLLRLASPFVPTLRELAEMRYLWKKPVRMVNERLLQILGHEPHTALDEAVEASLVGMGCLVTASGTRQ